MKRAYMVRPIADKAAALKVAQHLKSCLLPPVEIWRGKDPEALDTAAAYAQHVARENGLVEKEELNDDAKAATIADSIKGHEHDVMIVGRQSLLHAVTAKLINHSDPKRFKEVPAGGYWVLELNKDGNWWVQATCAPSQVGKS